MSSPEDSEDRMYPAAPLALIATMLAAAVPQPVPYGISKRCSVRTLRENPGYHYTVDQVRAAVSEAKVIVRAVAVDTTRMIWPAEYAYSPSDSGAVAFRVLESLRGSEIGERLIIPGVVVDQDDFNTGSVPYTMVRPSGQRGSCFTHEYRLGAEYLLLMTIRNGLLTPNWMSLAPMNEQITGPTDPWLEWVRDEVTSNR